MRCRRGYSCMGIHTPMAIIVTGGSIVTIVVTMAVVAVAVAVILMIA